MDTYGNEAAHTRPNFSQPSSRIALIYQSFVSRTTADRLYYDWIAEKNWSSSKCLVHLFARKQKQVKNNRLGQYVNSIIHNERNDPVVYYV